MNAQAYFLCEEGGQRRVKRWLDAVERRILNANKWAATQGADAVAFNERGLVRGLIAVNQPASHWSARGCNEWVPDRQFREGKSAYSKMQSFTLPLDEVGRFLGVDNVVVVGVYRYPVRVETISTGEYIVVVPYDDTPQHPKGCRRIPASLYWTLKERAGESWIG